MCFGWSSDHRVKLLIKLLLFIAWPLAVQAQPWRLESSSKPGEIGHGAVLVIKHLAGPVNAEMQLVFFDEQRCQLRIASNASSKTAKPLDEIGRALQAVAVCNGGYFHAGGDFGPAGLEIANGVRTDTFLPGAMGRWLDGATGQSRVGVGE